MHSHHRSAAPLNAQGEEFACWRRHDECFLGADLYGSDPEIQDRLMHDGFEQHRLAVNDARCERQPPRVKRVVDVMFLLRCGLDAHSDSIDFGHRTGGHAAVDIPA